MEKRAIVFPDVSKIGPYSHAVEANGFLFLSGIVPVDARKNLMIHDDITAATELVMQNIQGTLERLGSSLDKVVKTTVFLRDMKDFQAMNTVYGRYFTKDQPARSTVAVRELPAGLPVEIEVVAIK